MNRKPKKQRNSEVEVRATAFGQGQKYFYGSPKNYLLDPARIPAYGQIEEPLDSSGSCIQDSKDALTRTACLRKPSPHPEQLQFSGFLGKAQELILMRWDGRAYAP